MSKRRPSRDTTCPVPFKQAYPSVEYARYALTRNDPQRVGRTPDHVYLCQCGSYHLAGSEHMVRDTLRKRNHRTKGGPKSQRPRYRRRGCL